MDKPNVPKLPKGTPIRFFGEVTAELAKVTWPTRADTIKLTMAVIIISISVGLFIGGLDILFLKITSMTFGK